MLAPMRFSLLPHPSSPRSPPHTLDVEIARPRPDALQLRYTMRGALDGIALPPPSVSARADELWHHTCFEAFITLHEGDGYIEFNISPSRAWAAYTFDSYRSGMRPTVVEAPEIIASRDAESFRLDVALALPPHAGARVALTAVIEHANGELAYWALAHPHGQPDFHHRTGFVAELPAPETP